MTGPPNDLLKRIFAPWREVPPGNSFPPPAALAKALDESFPIMRGQTKKRDVHVDISIAKLFATAAIDAWQRSVHSLLVSALVSESSPIWSSVSGYYSSHYTMRGLAHLLGYYQLFQRKCQIQLSYEGGRYTCTYTKGYQREHEWYWGLAASSQIMGADPFFQERTLTAGLLSDVSHRDRSNYWDHLPKFQSIQSTAKERIQSKLSHMSKMEVLTPPDLREDKFPDPLSVQLSAYQRLVRFRRLLDNSLENNRMWSVQRNPSWASEFIDYQLTEARGAVQR